jgi:hypothetical protein
MKLQVYLSRLVIIVILLVFAVPSPPVEAAVDIPNAVTEEFTPTITLADGTEISAMEINSPPNPSSEYAEQRAASLVTSLDRATTLSNFPSYSWVFGCSAVSQAMIAAYYDNNGYPNLYTGPTNGGVMPASDMYAPYSGTYIWGQWYDSVSHPYPNNPLIASHNGVDGQTSRGSIDDYWVSYDSSANDPYISGSWAQHTWGTAVGDYMKTSQSAYNNVDGSTHFYTYLSGSNPLTCSVMLSGGVADLDGTYGRKLFYEARGYTVTDCYNQPTDNYITGGFNLADFQAEIDSGHPVLINVTGHSMVGFGYNGSTIYIRDTWDSNPEHVYSMTWGGTYDGRGLLGVSIVHIQQPIVKPSTFIKTAPGDGGMVQVSNQILSWESAGGTFKYEYCVDETDNGECNSTWLSNDVFTSVRLSGLDPDITYYWQVRAVNPIGTTYANGQLDAFWNFITTDAINSYLPFIIRN